MEQLKPIIKYHFWILCGIIVLTTIGAGFWAMSGQASTIKKQVQEIKTAKTEATGVMSVSADVGEEASVSVHPNEDTNEGMNGEIVDAKTEVMAAWQKLYSEQKDLLDWPLGALPEDVAKVFVPFRAERMAFELNNPELEAPSSVRKQVKEILPRVLPRLAEQIRAEWQVEDEDDVSDSKMPVDESPMESAMFNQPVTEWDFSDQLQWEAELTQFTGRNGNDDPLGTPTTMQVLFAKENLVLLNGVLEILKTVNEDAATPGQATVKRIQSILIGNQAHSAERMDLSKLSGGGGPAGGMDDRMAAMKNYASNLGKKPGESGGDKKVVSASELEKMDPAHMRYVNEKFEPISSGDYRKAITSKTLSDKSWMSVVKRVPVRLTLMIDERKIDDLLEACANGKLPLEVRQVTLVGGQLPESEAAAGAKKKKRTQRNIGEVGAGSGGSGATMTLSGEGPGAAGGAAGGAKGSNGNIKTQNYSTAEFNTNFDVPVEIYGFMKIYNEPMPEAIGAATAAAPAATE